MTAIPPIPYSFFDPDSERFETATSQPIAIAVNQGKQLDLSRIVSANGADIGSNGDGAGLTGSGDTKQTPQVFFANMPIEAAGLDQRPVPSHRLTLVIALLVAPLFFAGAVLVRQMCESKPTHPGGKDALKRVRAGQTIDELADAVRSFATQRLGLPSGATRRDIVDRLKTRGVDAQSLDRWLTTCETARYAPGLAHEVEAMRTEAARCIRDLEVGR